MRVAYKVGEGCARMLTNVKRLKVIPPIAGVVISILTFIIFSHVLALDAFTAVLSSIIAGGFTLIGGMVLVGYKIIKEAEKKGFVRRGEREFEGWEEEESGFYYTYDYAETYTGEEN